MGYAYESLQVLKCTDSPTDALKNTTKTMRIQMPCTLLRLMALVTVVADGDIVVTVTRRVTVGSDSGAVSVTTLTVPDTTAAGKQVYKDVSPVDLNVGDELKLAVSNTGTSTALELGALIIARSETPANQSDMVVSA